MNLTFDADSHDLISSVLMCIQKLQNKQRIDVGHIMVEVKSE